MLRNEYYYLKSINAPHTFCFSFFRRDKDSSFSIIYLYIRCYHSKFFFHYLKGWIRLLNPCLTLWYLQITLNYADFPILAHVQASAKADTLFFHSHFKKIIFLLSEILRFSHKKNIYDTFAGSDYRLKLFFKYLSHKMTELQISCYCTIATELFTSNTFFPC